MITQLKMLCVLAVLCSLSTLGAQQNAEKTHRYLVHPTDNFHLTESKAKPAFEAMDAIDNMLWTSSRGIVGKNYAERKLQVFGDTPTQGDFVMYSALSNYWVAKMQNGAVKAEIGKFILSAYSNERLTVDQRSEIVDKGLSFDPAIAEINDRESACSKSILDAIKKRKTPAVMYACEKASVDPGHPVWPTETVVGPEGPDLLAGGLKLRSYCTDAVEFAQDTIDLMIPTLSGQGGMGIAGRRVDEAVESCKDQGERYLSASLIGYAKMKNQEMLEQFVFLKERFRKIYKAGSQKDLIAVSWSEAAIAPKVKALADAESDCNSAIGRAIKAGSLNEPLKACTER